MSWVKLHRAGRAVNGGLLQAGIILVDLGLPDMDGKAVVKALREGRKRRLLS